MEVEIYLKPENFKLFNKICQRNNIFSFSFQLSWDKLRLTYTSSATLIRFKLQAQISIFLSLKPNNNKLNA